jgi:hypothetical protein
VGRIPRPDQESGRPAMDQLTSATWRTSSYSGDNGGDCIQVTTTAPAIAVRDSKNPAGPQLAFTAEAWTAFTRQLKTNR